MVAVGASRGLDAGTTGGVVDAGTTGGVVAATGAVVPYGVVELSSSGLACAVHP